MAKKVVAPAVKPVVFPKTLYAVFSNHGTEDEYLANATEVGDLEGSDNPTPQVVRYRLVGVGGICKAVPRYVETEEV